ncbi:MAG: mechanosensitive ion channel [Flavobacteriaceae bacterium]|nr:mechanosensitive ion channel [Flavobacteriaceae bacterium]
MNKITDFFNYPIRLGSEISFSVGALIIILFVFILTRFFLKLSKRLLLYRMDEDTQYKFRSIFTFFNYFVYLIIILITFDNIGVNVTAIFAASAALLVGVGLALQTFIQDIISGIFIIADKAVHVGDIIDIDGQIGKVENITLRTTRAVTIDNKVLIIPNHKFLTSILYNWTENGVITREHIIVGVAYDSDVNLVQQLLIDCATQHKQVLKKPIPSVLLKGFGDNALIFQLFFTINKSFIAERVKSDIRFSILAAFDKNKIDIPFPQRTVWVNKTEAK